MMTMMMMTRPVPVQHPVDHGDGCSDSSFDMCYNDEHLLCTVMSDGDGDEEEVQYIYLFV